MEPWAAVAHDSPGHKHVMGAVGLPGLNTDHIDKVNEQALLNRLLGCPGSVALWRHPREGAKMSMLGLRAQGLGLRA